MFASYVQWVLPELSSTVQQAKKYFFMHKRCITATLTGQILKFTFVPHCLRPEKLNLRNNKGFGDMHFAIKVHFGVPSLWLLCNSASKSFQTNLVLGH